MPLLQPTATYYGGDVANDNYYLRKGQPIPSGQTLTSAVLINSEDRSTQAGIFVEGNTSSTYKGAISLVSGANGAGPPMVVLNGRTTGEATMNFEVGDNAQTNNLMVAGPEGVSQVFDGIYNPVDAITNAPVVQTITPTGFSPNATNIRPLFYDTTTNKIVVANTSLIRFFEVATPSDKGINVVIKDPSGNTYLDPEWLCCVAGFVNGGSDGGDRTFSCVTIQTAGSPWTVQYNNASPNDNNYVNILAIHRSLLTGG
jgi:hypothetical protein